MDTRHTSKKISVPRIPYINKRLHTPFEESYALFTGGNKMTQFEQEVYMAVAKDTLVRIAVELDALQQEEMIVVFGDLQIEVGKKEIKKYFNEEYSTVRVSKVGEEEIMIRHLGAYLDDVIGGFEAYEKAKKPVVKKRMGWSNHSHFATGGDASSCDGCCGGPCNECKIIEQK